ncbi:MAG: pyridoxamine 5'-phosphate oxidase family protein [Sphaerochaetaceae bacterium]|nr:pyridoxamine 5'-phosphate oxidase family protein [Sphaerochaetaceae bacterium]
MRRKDREVTDPDVILYILKKSKVLHLGLVDGNEPYIVPMNYGYTFEDGKLTFYVHSAPEGRKLDIIRKNPSCCAQLECDGALIESAIACKYGYSFYSLEGFGKALIVEDNREKIKALSLLMEEQTGRSFTFTEDMVSNVEVIRIECSDYSAKHRPLNKSGS